MKPAGSGFESRVRIVVPLRAGDAHRDRLWQFCGAWWNARFPDWELVEGHHDLGPFNRGAAINAGARGDWDILVVIDGDVVVNAEQLEAAVAGARRTGRCTLAYDRYVGLNEQITRQVLDGYNGNWENRPELKMASSHVSSIVVVPRKLWETVDGFDERFVGWGYEDLAFIESCRVLGGGIDRVPGAVYHLWHPHTAERKKSPLLRAAAALANRYYEAILPDDMAALVAERDESVCMIVLTDGRRDCISRTIPAAEKHLTGLPITRKIISDDSGDREYHAWLRHRFPDWTIVVVGGSRRGFAGAVRTAWELALQSGQPWVFWLEDDFILEREVDLDDVAQVLTTNPHVKQMALRRQAWFAPEIEAGGVIEQDPDAYEDHDAGRCRWLEHAVFWTTNPHLVARATLAEHEWPNARHSEAVFARTILRDGNRSGYWEARTAAPIVTHVGERSGTGY